ncbi:MAG: cation diffusion facilitator family transporter [Candidatus Nanosalina sp.]
MSDSHGHEHGDTSSRKLGAVSGINLVGFVVELLGGIMFGSVALMSDAFHMLFDATAYLMAFFSAYKAERRGDGSDWSFGLHRLETLSAFFNGALLLLMAGYILWESYQRFLNPVEIGVVPTIVIGTGGLLVNLFSVYYLQDSEKSLNEKGAFYHLLGDAGGSIAVVTSALVIHFTGFYAADPITAVLIAGLVVWSALKVLRGSTRILLQKSPVDTEDVEDQITEIEEVHGVKDIRIWSLCSQIVIASLHICDNSENLEESNRKKNKIREILRDSGVDHSTIEMEKHGDDNCSHEVKH